MCAFSNTTEEVNYNRELHVLLKVFPYIAKKKKKKKQQQPIHRYIYITPHHTCKIIENSHISKVDLARSALSSFRT